MNGAGQSAQMIGKAVHIHIGYKAFRIHFRRLRMKDQVCSRTLAQRGIMIQISRVACQILIGSELGRIHKYTDYGMIIVPYAGSDETLMSRMQETHGGHKSHALSGCSPALHDLSYFCNCGCDLHSFILLFYHSLITLLFFSLSKYAMKCFILQGSQRSFPVLHILHPSWDRCALRPDNFLPLLPRHTRGSLPSWHPPHLRRPLRTSAGNH